jgi:hypothetical protein
VLGRHGFYPVHNTNIHPVKQLFWLYLGICKKQYVGTVRGFCGEMLAGKCYDDVQNVHLGTLISHTKFRGHI